MSQPDDGVAVAIVASANKQNWVREIAQHSTATRSSQIPGMSHRGATRAVILSQYDMNLGPSCTATVPRRMHRFFCFFSCAVSRAQTNPVVLWSIVKAA